MERKSQHFSLIASGVLFLVLVVLSLWQTSFSTGDFRPRDPATTFVLWGVSTLVVLGVFALGFILFRSLLKLYIERRRNQLGSKIKTKLVAGALILSIVPVISMVLFSFFALNRTLDKWFKHPTEQILRSEEELNEQLNDVMRRETEDYAAWIASRPETVAALAPRDDEAEARRRFTEIAASPRADYVVLSALDGTLVTEIRGRNSPPEQAFPGLARGDPGKGKVASGVAGNFVWASAPVHSASGEIGRVKVVWRIPEGIEQGRAALKQSYSAWASLHSNWKEMRYFYLSLMALIAVFTLFVAVWLSLFLSKQIITPIEALVAATGELSSGRLDYRVETPAIDELGGLVHSFNHMTQRLEDQTHQLQESNRELERANTEIESRRRYINAILENITPGVISTTAEREILRTNSSARKIFELEESESSGKFEALFPAEDARDLRYIFNRAWRTGAATHEFELRRGGRILHLAVTVTALEDPVRSATGRTSRFVVVVEDASEILLAQKSAAWSEVARRVAHEIKNPLTPIALSAERMRRLLDRFEQASSEEEREDLRERFRGSTETIAREVETLRLLVDEFSQFARFPKARPEPTDLNRVIEEAFAVFEGRLDGVALRSRADPDLPRVMVDPAQFKRAVVNLIDNAAEAVRDSWVKEILVTTSSGAAPDTVELAVEDTGSGVSADDKQKLFQPYFSTKKRGAGLGLAIVSRIVAEHRGTIRVEDKRPSGARFIIEIPTAETAAPVLTGTAS